MWQWLREGKSWPTGLAGGLIIVLYGVIPTFQTDPHFSRVYAAYGGVFIMLSHFSGDASLMGLRLTAGTCSERPSA